MCHTPPELFGTRAESEGVDDTAWLQKIAGTGWVVLNRDAKIMQRPDELAAYRAARVHMFYLPGEATREHLKRLVEAHLRDIVTYATNRKPEVWRITDAGVQRFTQRASGTRTRRR